VSAPFASALAGLGIKLPLRVGRNVEAGVVFDAERRVVATVDVDRERSDRAALAIAKLIVDAVNTRAGP